MIYEIRYINVNILNVFKMLIDLNVNGWQIMGVGKTRWCKEFHSLAVYRKKTKTILINKHIDLTRV